MEIKTLAQILAENEGNSKSEKSNRPKKSYASKKAQNSNTGGALDKSATLHRKMEAKFNASINSNDTSSDDTSDEQPRAKKYSEGYTKKKTYKRHAKKEFNAQDDFITNTNDEVTTDTVPDTASGVKKTRRKKKKQFHPAAAYTPKIVTSNATASSKQPNINSIKSILASVKLENQSHPSTSFSLHPNIVNDFSNLDLSDHYYIWMNKENLIDNKNSDGSIDNLTTKLKAALKTDEQRQAEKEELKANSRLRWLAFYYLSRREHSRGELKQKLIAKEQDPAKIDALLNEFAEKGYQSDYRTAMMLIREGIRKKHGRTRIKQSFYQRKLAAPSNIDELIDMATEDSDAFADMMSDDPLIDGVDWLKLAVEARIKKYGNTLPETPKQKAKQLRFLQYRGFSPDICFDALKYTLSNLDDRF